MILVTVVEVVFEIAVEELVAAMVTNVLIIVLTEDDVVVVAIIVLFANEDVDVHAFDVFVTAVVVIVLVVDTVDVFKSFFSRIENYYWDHCCCCSCSSTSKRGLSCFIKCCCKKWRCCGINKGCCQGCFNKGCC